MDRQKLRLRLFVVMITTGFFQPLFADSSDVIELLDVLKQNGVISEEQYQSLYDSQIKKMQQTQKIEMDQAKKKDNAPTISFKDGGPKIESADKAYSAELHGRVQVDSAWYNDDKRSLGDGAEIRRGYLAVQGVLASDYAYKLEYDFAASDFRDAYLRFTHFDPFLLTIGHMKEPFSLEQVTSDLHTTFMERSLADVFAPGYRVGIMGSAYNQYGTLALGGFSGISSGSHPAEDGGGGGEGDNGWHAVSRATFSPIHTEGKVAHMGAAVDYWSTNDENPRFRQRPESHVTDMYLVDTNPLGPSDSILTFGTELAGVWGPASIQGEYMQANVDRKEGSNPTFSGWYAYASYFLTGESRPYDYKTGTFGRIKPKRNFPNGPGAWELAARYSSLDLQDKYVKGGKQDDVTVGLNWYLNPQIKVKAEYVMIDAKPSSAYSGNSEQKGKDDSPEVYQMRVQYDF